MKYIYFYFNNYRYRRDSFFIYDTESIMKSEIFNWYINVDDENRWIHVLDNKQIETLYKRNVKLKRVLK